MQRWNVPQRNYLEALIQLEVAKILQTAGLGHGARVDASCATLGRSFAQVWAQARERVLDSIGRRHFVGAGCGDLALTSRVFSSTHRREALAGRQHPGPDYVTCS
jgi:hypothetical protein